MLGEDSSRTTSDSEQEVADTYRRHRSCHGPSHGIQKNWVNGGITVTCTMKPPMNNKDAEPSKNHTLFTHHDHCRLK